MTIEEIDAMPEIVEIPELTVGQKNYIRNKAGMRASAKKWQTANHDKFLACQYEWRKNNKEYWQAYNRLCGRIRTAKKAGDTLREAMLRKQRDMLRLNHHKENTIALFVASAFGIDGEGCE